jgi:hypothetical protein
MARTSQLANGLRERSRSDTVRVRVCPITRPLKISARGAP